jgi:hypothetical protein
MQSHEHPMSEAIASREADVALLFAAANGEDVTANGPTLDSLGVDVENVEESAAEALDAYALSVETLRFVDVVLGVGGPTVYLRAQVDAEADRVGAVVLFDSWAVPQEVTLPDSSPLVDLFDRFAGVAYWRD